MSDNKERIFKNLVFHHTGILVRNIERSRKYYGSLFSPEFISEVFSIESQKVFVCFVKTSNDVYLELIQPHSDNLDFGNFYKRGINYYHVGFLTDEFDIAMKELEKVNFRTLNVFKSEAFNNNRCAFLLTQEMQLFELIEK